MMRFLGMVIGMSAKGCTPAQNCELTAEIRSRTVEIPLRCATCWHSFARSLTQSAIAAFQGGPLGPASAVTREPRG
ncbi:MAG: hypothetical protein AAGC79_11990 [Pseudomonadota bacterium]